MSTQQKRDDSDQSLTFEDVSKLFSLPLSEASDILGVSMSILKSICNENGLERWPHRKYLAGKSIEDIKIEAAKEKSKAGLQRVDRQKGGTASSTASPSLGSRSRERPSRTVPESSRSQASTQQSGSSNMHTWRFPSLLNSRLIVETTAGLDEFKHGFPSDGLSTHSNKWWGSGSPDPSDGNPEDESRADREEKHESNMRREKGADGEQLAVDRQGKVSLSALREGAVKEAGEALKLGIWRECGVESLGRKDSLLVSRLFRND